MALAPSSHGGATRWRPSADWRRLGRAAAAELGFIAAYVALDWASTIPSFTILGTTPWSPATGLGLAWLIGRGFGGGIALLVAVVLSAVVIHLPPESTLELLATGIVTGAGCMLTALALKRTTSFDPELERLADFIVLLVAAALSAMAPAIVYVAAFLWWVPIQPTEFLAAALRQWVGDVIGIAVVTPILLRLRRQQNWRALSWRWEVVAEVALWAATIGALLWVIFGLSWTDEYKFFYLLFLPVVAIAVRHGIDGACLALLMTQLGIIIWLERLRSSAAMLTEFQLLLLALTITGLLTGAVVSERQRAERATREFERRLRESQDELEQASRLSALGEMATTLAHELNQPMTASRAYIRTAQRLLAQDAAKTGAPATAGIDRAADAIGNAVTQIDLAANIVRTLREQVRGRGFAPELVRIEEIIDQSLALLRSQVRVAGIRIGVRCDGGLPPVVTERVRVQQVMLNLLRNAIDAVRAVPASRRQIDVEARIDAAGKHVEIAVRDHGPGVRPDIAERLFDAFVTDKVEGLGLGLSICRGIIQSQGGRMWLESSGPQGADFRFTLPTARARMQT